MTKLKAKPILKRRYLGLRILCILSFALCFTISIVATFMMMMMMIFFVGSFMTVFMGFMGPVSGGQLRLLFAGVMGARFSGFLMGSLLQKRGFLGSRFLKNERGVSIRNKDKCLTPSEEKGQSKR